MVYTVGRQFQIMVYIIYLVEIAIINFEVQKTLLENFGITQETELSYKAIYYMPLLQVSRQVSYASR